MTIMSDDHFIGYCELHSKTERALFNAEQINRIRALAGMGISIESGSGWYSVYNDEMQPVCDMAKSRLKALRDAEAGTNIIQGAFGQAKNTDKVFCVVDKRVLDKFMQQKATPEFKKLFDTEMKKFPSLTSESAIALINNHTVRKGR